MKKNPSENRDFERFTHHTSHLSPVSRGREGQGKKCGELRVCYCFLILLAAVGDLPELLTVWIFSGVSALV